MKKWRPDGWRKLLERYGVYHDDALGRVKAEAGATAMYEAIWKMAKESPTGTYTFDTNDHHCF